MKILHLCKDYPWFKGGYKMFEEAFPDENKYILLTSKPNLKIKNLNEINNLELISNNNISVIENLLKDFDLVIIHGFTDLIIADIILREVVNCKFIWFIMGADMYQNNFIYNKPLYGKITTQIINKHLSEINLLEKLKDIYRFFRYRNLSKTKSDFEKKKIVDAIKKIDLIGTFQPEQFYLLKELNVIRQQTQRIHFTYYPLEYIIQGHDNSNEELGRDILLGNSASYTNNHLEIIDKINKAFLKGRKLYVPLNYGNTRYAKEIISHGKSHLGDLFVPVQKFLTLPQYNSLVHSCGFVVMNHYRGQAAGNVISSLYKGCKVFMNKRNIIYKYLVNLGCHVFNIEDDLYEDNAFTALTTKQIKNNRLILEKELSGDVIVRNLQNQLSEYV